MKLIFIILIVVYDFILFKACIRTMDVLLKKVMLIISHFAFSTLVGFIYYQFVQGYQFDTPAFIVCVYISIAPLFFLISKNRNQKIIGNLMNRKNDNSFLAQKELLMIFFAITLILQLILLFNY